MASGAFLLLTTTWVLYTCQAYDVHKHMTIEELRSTFHVDSHDLVPEYEVVHIHHLSHNENGKRRRSIESSNSYRNNLIDTDNAEGVQKEREQTASPPPLKANSKQYGKTSEILKMQEKLRLKAFGRPLHLSLVRNEGLLKKTGLKLWTVEPNATSQHGVEYVEIPEVHEDIGEIYQDENHEAAILLKKNKINGELIVEGSIGSELVIKPIPSRLKAKALNAKPKKANNSSNTEEEITTEEDLVEDDEMFLDQDGELSSEVAIDTGLPIKRKDKERQRFVAHQHIVYKRKNSNEPDPTGDYAFMEPDHMHKRYRRSANQTSSVHSRTRREAPYTIYPEILVIVDYDGYRLHGGDNVQIKRYFVSFWNGVDLRYKLLKGPKIRISIAGIIISRGRDATPYLERNRVGRDAIDSAAALTDMGKYLFRERRLPVYDIAVAITKLDMCRRQYTHDACNRGTAGFAYVGGACVVNKRLEKVNSVAIIEDTGGFSGIIVAAHEVGHLLGAVHDGSPPPSYLGGPGAEKCQWADGYIMSDLRHTERGFRWSPCSVSSFHHFLNGDTATCLYNSPHEDDGLPRVLPGKLLTLDAQCRKDRGTSACFKDDRVCAQLFCFDAGSGYCVAYRPAAEGSPCGDGQYCLNGRCVAEHENIIPDYTQNTPSYIRQHDGNQGRPLFYEDGGVTPPSKFLEITAPPVRNRYQPPQQQTIPPQIQTTLPPRTTPVVPPRPQYQPTTPRPQYQPTTPRPQYQPTTPRPQYQPTTTTRPPFYYTTQQTTKRPQFYFTTTRTTTTTTRRPFSLSTTRSPYNFQNFGRPYNPPSVATTRRPVVPQTYATTTTTKRPYYTQPQVPNVQSTTKNPYIGDYYNLRKKTTRNPYDFANFGRPRTTTKSPFDVNYHDNINNNYLKRSYNAESYYSAASTIRNSTIVLQHTIV